MKNFGKSSEKIGVVILFLTVQTMAYSLNPFSWSNPSSPDPTIVDPAVSPFFLRSPFKPCPGSRSRGFMRKVEVTPACGMERCKLIRGTNVTLDFDFIPNFPAKTVVGTVYGVLPLLPAIRFGKPENLCTSNQVECPLQPGKLYNYRTTVFVKPSYPRIKLDTKIVIQGDESTEPIACTIIPVEITNPSS